MRNQYSRPEWLAAIKKDPGLQGVSPLEAAKRLGITEQEVGELMLHGYLNVSDICENRRVIKIVIPERDVQQYAATHRAQKAKNPTDPNLLARSVVEAAIGESLNIETATKRSSRLKRHKKLSS